MNDPDLLLAHKLHMELNGVAPTATMTIPVIPAPPIITLPATLPLQQESAPPDGTKGLDNPLGHNNCFLNVVLQSMSHLRTFVNALQECAHKCTTSGCVVCGLRHLMLSVTRDQKPYLNPAEMRQLLHRLVGIGLKDMGDAVETFDAVVSAIRSSCDNPTDTIHAVFGSCDANGLIVSVSDVSRKPDDDLSSIVLVNSDMRKYVSVLPVQVVWNQMKYMAQPEVLRKDLTSLLEMIPPSMIVGEFFNKAHNHTGVYVDSPADVMCNVRTRANLVSVIAYYGCHYFTYSWVASTKAWYKFDDREVRHKGTTWDGVRQDMLSGKAQPVLFFYELECPVVVQDFIAV
jgi:hypothetical protein